MVSLQTQTDFGFCYTLESIRVRRLVSGGMGRKTGLRKLIAGQERRFRNGLVWTYLAAKHVCQDNTLITTSTSVLLLFTNYK